MCHQIKTMMSVVVGGYCVFIDLIFAMVTLKWAEVSVVVGNLKMQL